MDKNFEYEVPIDLIKELRVGSRVLVPFGKSRQVDGYVISLSNESSYAKHKLILKHYGHFVPKNLMILGEWIANYYCASRIKVIRSLLPAPIRNNQTGEKQVYIISLPEKIDLSTALEALAKSKTQLKVFKEVIAQKELPMSLLRKICETSQSPIESLINKNYLVKTLRQENRSPFKGNVVPSQKLKLTEEQQSAYNKIENCIESKKYHTVLLQGVTGSGKTEVYLQAIDKCLSLGKEAILLVPEISLTPQTIYRFRARFDSKVSILHSRLSTGERYDQWMQIYKGKTQIVVGARSALFAPFKNLGLIIVDEEHESSYKQMEQPRYNARDVAVMRGHLGKCTVVLGSATPSLESLYNVELGKYHCCLLKERAEKQAMPKMSIIDMRYEKQESGEAKILSSLLIQEIKQNLNEGMQTILFLNRRGFSNHLQCLACGNVYECERCNASFSYHRHTRLLQCHLCGNVEVPPKACSECSSDELRYSGIGIEKIIDIITKLFPKARIGRMDSDSMTSKSKYELVLNKVLAGQVDILVGTQMITKGLHFPKVTLVGIILADLSLNIPDFRSSERTFQLITQVAGRAGRGEVEGKVIIQSYTPFHPAIQSAAEESLEEFAQLEMQGRKAYNYPPFSQMFIINFTSEDEQLLQQFCQQFYTQLIKHIDSTKVKINPPMPNSIPKVRDKYRYQIFAYNNGNMIKVAKLVYFFIKEAKYNRKKISVQVDVDPQNLI